MKDKKSAWYEAENIALKYFQNLWFELIEKNYTIKGWEIDLILKAKEIFVFVEVKLVDWVENIDLYISNKKLKTLQKTILTYISEKDIQDYRLDVVFVKNSKIFEHYENIYID